jgi:3-deoxy-D-manno-octulosonate 8-phosphate phosphatase (KDO 8-P phosphatase)
LIPPALTYSLRRRLLNPKLSRIRLVVCDVDGVLTDGGLSYDEEGKVVKRFNVRDGLAVRMLQQAGITVALLSGGRGGAGEQRALHPVIHHCRVGVGNKRAGLEELRPWPAPPGRLDPAPPRRGWRTAEVQRCVAGQSGLDGGV